MRKTLQREVEAVGRLTGPERFKHFVKRVVDEGEAWGLWRDGWVLMGDNEETPVFPVWPASEYASLCAIDSWSDCQPSAISLERLCSELAPKLAVQGLSFGVFPAQDGRGIVMPPLELCNVLDEEGKKYG